MDHGGFHHHGVIAVGLGVGTVELVGFPVCDLALLAAPCGVVAERAAVCDSPRAAWGGTFCGQGFDGGGCGAAFAGGFVRAPVLLLTGAAAVVDLVAAAAALGAGGGAGGVVAGLGHCFLGEGLEEGGEDLQVVDGMCELWRV